MLQKHRCPESPSRWTASSKWLYNRLSFQPNNLCQNSAPKYCNYTFPPTYHSSVANALLSSKKETFFWDFHWVPDWEVLANLVEGSTMHHEGNNLQNPKPTWGNTTPKFNTSPLKSCRNPIGKDRLPSPTSFQGRAVKLQGGVMQLLSGNTLKLLYFTSSDPHHDISKQPG